MKKKVRTQRKAFSAWQAYLQHKRCSRCLLAHANWTANHVRLQRALLAWQAVHQLNLRSKMQLHEAAAHRNARRTCLIFFAWYAFFLVAIILTYPHSNAAAFFAEFIYVVKGNIFCLSIPIIGYMAK